MTWMFISMQARGVDESILASDETVRVEENAAYIVLAPVPDTAVTGLLFYPGGLVDPVAYTPMARSVAEAGFKAVIIKVPYRLALMEWQQREVYDRTQEMLREDRTRKWVLGGHSRGGRTAIEFAERAESELGGLLLVGTSHPREKNLSRLRIPVMKVYASEDGLASKAEVEAYSDNLPEHTRWMLIEGGNHAQFAWYGTQLGDQQATIGRAEQQRQLVAAIIEMLRDIRS